MYIVAYLLCIGRIFNKYLLSGWFPGNNSWMVSKTFCGSINIATPAVLPGLKQGSERERERERRERERERERRERREREERERD